MDFLSQYTVGASWAGVESGRVVDPFLPDHLRVGRPVLVFDDFQGDPDPAVLFHHHPRQIGGFIGHRRGNIEDQVQAVRIAGFSQETPGLVGIIRIDGSLRVVAEVVGGQVTVEGLRRAMLDFGNDLIHVEGIVQGLPNAGVTARALL